MSPTEFHKLYDKRLRRYARRLTTELSLPASMREDLYQACWLVIPRQLAKWEPEGGLSAFNWCASAMKREMTAEFRRYHANPGYGWRREISYFVQPLGDREGVAEYVDLDLRIDVANSVEKLGESRNNWRFLRAALNDANGAELAEETGQSRQAVNASLRSTAGAWVKMLAPLADEAPSLKPESRRTIAWAHDWRGMACLGEQINADSAFSRR